MPNTNINSNVTEPVRRDHLNMDSNIPKKTGRKESIAAVLRTYYGAITVAGVFITVVGGLLPIWKNLTFIDNYPRLTVLIVALVFAASSFLLHLQRQTATTETAQIQEKLSQKNVELGHKEIELNDKIAELKQKQLELDQTQKELETLVLELKRPTQRDMKTFEEFRVNYAHGSDFMDILKSFEPLKHTRNEAKNFRYFCDAVNNMRFDDSEVGAAHQHLLEASKKLSEWLSLNTAPTSGNPDLMAADDQSRDSAGISKYDDVKRKGLEKDSLSYLRLALNGLQEFENVARKQGL